YPGVFRPPGGAPRGAGVWAPPPPAPGPPPPRGARGSPTVTAYSLDETAIYFLVLVALCEPRLRDESPVAVPTTPEIVDRLAGLPGCAQLTARAVSSHIDYLADEKTRISAPAETGPGRGPRRNGKREALVGLALRFGLVREEHLALLPPRAGGGEGAAPGRLLGK
ncbi:serine/threonine protein kinase, partial [Streptomyces lavendulae]